MRAKKSRRSTLLSGIITALILSLAVLVAVDMQIRPIVQKLAQYQGREIATGIISRSVRDVLQDSTVACENLAKITYNINGGITSVQTDVTKMNQIQSQISLAVNSGVAELETATIEIPLGTLSGLTYFNARGPVFKFKLRQQGYVKTRLASTFTAAGINQTLHQIVLTVEARAVAVVPTNYTEFEVVSQYILAETVVVGNVPNAYTYVTGDTRDQLTQIGDYSAQ